jgi:hypothetical protein
MEGKGSSEYTYTLDQKPPITTDKANARSCRARSGWFSKQFWLKPQACSPTILPPAKHSALLRMTVRLFQPRSRRTQPRDAAAL